MKIAQINKIIQFKGGVETVMANIAQGFRARGDQVLNLGFSTSGVTIPDSVSLGPDRKKISRFFWDGALVRDVVRRLDEFQPDIVVTHNVYHSFPHAQLARALKQRGSKLVGILHDYKCVCPSYGLHIAGKICESCQGKNFYKAAIRKCHKNSRLVSAILAADAYWNVRWKDAYSHYDVLISPSHFLKDKCMELGFKHPIKVLRNPIDFEVQPDSGFENRKNAVLFAASLDESKGTPLVLELAKQLPQVQFYVAGDGPWRDKVLSAQARSPNLKYLGYVNREGIQQKMRECKVFLMASSWYENNPMVILEAISQHCLVIGAEHGGIGELLSNGKGCLFVPSDVSAARVCIERCMAFSQGEYTEFVHRSLAALDECELKGYCHSFENLSK